MYSQLFNFLFLLFILSQMVNQLSFIKQNIKPGIWKGNVRSWL